MAVAAIKLVMNEGRVYTNLLNAELGWRVLYLASDQTPFVTGSDLAIEGGTTAQRRQE